MNRWVPGRRLTTVWRRFAARPETASGIGSCSNFDWAWVALTAPVAVIFCWRAAVARRGAGAAAGVACPSTLSRSAAGVTPPIVDAPVDRPKETEPISRGVASFV
jgi:hypothetical protein